MASDAKPLTDAQRQLVEGHLDVVDRIVSKFRRSDDRIAVEDLRSVGRLALVEAASRYRRDGGASFRTFASIRIAGAFGDETRVRAGGRRPDKKKYGRIPASLVSSLEQALEQGLDVGADDPAHEELLSRDLVDRAIARLPERDRLIVTLWAYENMPLHQIGEVLGVSEARVSQLFTKAKARMRAEAGHFGR